MNEANWLERVHFSRRSSAAATSFVAWAAFTAMRSTINPHCYAAERCGSCSTAARSTVGRRFNTPRCSRGRPCIASSRFPRLCQRAARRSSRPANQAGQPSTSGSGLAHERFTPIVMVQPILCSRTPSASAKHLPRRLGHACGCNHLQCTTLDAFTHRAKTSIKSTCSSSTCRGRIAGAGWRAGPARAACHRLDLHGGQLCRDRRPEQLGTTTYSATSNRVAIGCMGSTTSPTTVETRSLAGRCHFH